MLKFFLLVLSILLSVNFFVAQNNQGKIIYVINDVSENMTELSFVVNEGLESDKFNEWVNSAKQFDLIDQIIVNNKKEITWKFKRCPTLSDFKYMFALMQIDGVNLKDKKMTTVDFTTFGFSK